MRTEKRLYRVSFGLENAKHSYLATVVSNLNEFLLKINGLVIFEVEVVVKFTVVLKFRRKLKVENWL